MPAKAFLGIQASVPHFVVTEMIFKVRIAVSNCYTLSGRSIFKTRTTRSSYKLKILAQCHFMADKAVAAYIPDSRNQRNLKFSCGDSIFAVLHPQILFWNSWKLFTTCCILEASFCIFPHNYRLLLSIIAWLYY